MNTIVTSGNPRHVATRFVDSENVSRNFKLTREASRLPALIQEEA